jgi:uncharacterized protein (DUF305 family)
MPTLRLRSRSTALLLAALVATLILAAAPGTTHAAQGEATPEALTCAEVAATPTAAMAGMAHGHGHDATPAAGMAHMDHDDPQADFDLMYIDMMIPHHESVVALAGVARSELAHPDLIAMAEEIISTQDAEIEALRELRAEWYPDAPTVTMDEMMAGMPGMGTDMAVMDQVMSPEWQVRSFCAADDKDLAFIEQVIPHHQMAIATSQDALEMAVHPELIAIAEQVIEAQQQEIAVVERVRGELSAGATPSS